MSKFWQILHQQHGFCFVPTSTTKTTTRKSSHDRVTSVKSQQHQWRINNASQWSDPKMDILTFTQIYACWLSRSWLLRTWTVWKKLQARSSLKLNSSFFRNEVPSHLKRNFVLELFAKVLPTHDNGRIFNCKSPPPFFLCQKEKYANDPIKDSLRWIKKSKSSSGWLTERGGQLKKINKSFWKEIHSLNKCSNLSQPLDKLNLVGRLIATLHWFLTACWWKFWKRKESQICKNKRCWLTSKTRNLSNILHHHNTKGHFSNNQFGKISSPLVGQLHHSRWEPGSGLFAQDN